MSWVRVEYSGCECLARPDVTYDSVCESLLERRIGPGSWWQCPELDCSHVWEIAEYRSALAEHNWYWKRVHFTDGGSSD